MSVMILGADGYLGWPLAMRMARRFPEETVVLVDNRTRRRLVDQVGGRSITPVLELSRRLDCFERTFHLHNLTAVDVDVAGADLDRLIEEFKPRLVFHLAQIGSAGFSMMGPEQAAFTVQNNECGNMRVLWAMRRHCPGAHLIKSGSMGQYAKCGLDIPEGYFIPEVNGRVATDKVLFPRASDDVYHISKINDTNYNAMAARKFGLKITDVMQATVFGVHTEETRAHADLATRFDQDEYFGTVLNRFIAQAVIGEGLTVYGTGYQRTGLMALEDAIRSLELIALDPPPAGVHRFVNSVTEKNFCVREIAERIVACARASGLDAGISYQYDPRGEREESKLEYEIHARYLAERLKPQLLEQVVQESFFLALKHRERIQARCLRPRFDWHPERMYELT